ncbi:hypothetical protein QP495_06165 [Lactobacillus crispatus]|nr:hypothetical protein [Lactobacillus crispatus]MDK7313552.1 hypothetical protein [Lactobacillus crispatus]
MNKFETLTYEELSAVFGGNGGKARRVEKSQIVLKLLEWER